MVQEETLSRSCRNYYFMYYVYCYTHCDHCCYCADICCFEERQGSSDPTDHFIDYFYIVYYMFGIDEYSFVGYVTSSGKFAECDRAGIDEIATCDDAGSERFDKLGTATTCYGPGSA